MNKLKPILIVLSLTIISILIGYTLSIFTDLYWSSASVFSACALIMIGSWIFEDGATAIVEYGQKSNEEIQEIENDVKKLTHLTIS